ncbi:helix-turn-helix transcriptional regulator [Leisingera sp.]|uniref:helix-turn-helix transcriptional regulator n=1 Tax=Leisingera sp. TaxID=1879318 RepID=UPI002B26CF35|nr:LuxR C-terminal-related transcriptional regulator [Leisingera sp.]
MTDRETEVGNLLIKGFNSKEISKFLGISDGTVRNHTKKVYAKLQVRSQAELCGLFIEQALTIK